MRLNRRWVAVAVGCAAVAGAFVTGRLWATGIPSTGALTYSGTLEDANGTPATGSPNIQVNFWNSAVANGTALCQTPSAAIPLTAGRFSVLLPDACTKVVQGNPDVWAEIVVSGSSLGLTKLGAVPYAVEANHAVNATNAADGGGIASAISSLQDQVASVYYAEATAGVTAPTDSTWVSVPGVAVSFSTSRNENAELYALVWVSTTSAAAACSLRFMLDGSVVGSTFEGSVTVVAPFGASSFLPLVAFRRVPISAGTHNASVQVSKGAGIFAGATCDVGDGTYPAIGRLRVGVGP